MADHIIHADEQGAYEIALDANTPITIQVDARYGTQLGTLSVTVHSGTRPVYARAGNTVEVGDPKASQVSPYTWEDLYLNPNDGATITLISAEPAIVSVARA